jgi:hypothetical protein
VWSITDINGVSQSSALLTSQTATSCLLTEANFATARNGTLGVKVKATITDGSTFADEISVLRVQQGATGAAGLSLELSTYSLTVLANNDGSTKGSQLPKTIVAALKAGATDVSGGATFTVPTSSGNTNSITGGTITITAVDADGYVDLRCVYGSFDVTKRVQVLKVADQPPPASVTPPAGGYSTSQPISSFAAVSSTSYPAAPSSTVSVRSDASGALRGVANINYAPDMPPSGSRSFRLTGKIVYRVAGSGGAWSDFAAEQSGSTSSSTGPPEPETREGSLSFTVDKTGLTASTDYECGFVGRQTVSGYTTTPYGSVVIKQPGV